MSSTFPFYQVDVFSPKLYKGNPVAVTVIKDEKLAKQLSQKGKDEEVDKRLLSFANWTNLSESTFIFPSSDKDEEFDFIARIFSPKGEIIFGGHPTLGNCKAFLENGNQPKKEGIVIQKCQIGLVPIKVESNENGQLLSFLAPPLRKQGQLAANEIDAFCKAMNISSDQVIESQWIVNGSQWCFLRLKDAKAVLDVELNDTSAALQIGEGIWGIIGHYEPGEHPDGVLFEVRAFPVGHGILEDPICGSFNAGLAKWMKNSKCEQGLKDGKVSYIVSQGTRLDREGRVFVQEDENGQLWIGGHTEVCIEGKVKLP